MKNLYIYYDNPTEASNMYLKMLRKDADERGINIILTDSMKYLYDNFIDGEDFVLPLYPVSTPEVENEIMRFLKNCPDADVDNISGKSPYNRDATAMGIYEHIINNYPNRETAIGVIGRGKVGKELVDLLISYGYTVFNYNSKTPRDLLQGTAGWVNILVGVSSQDYIIEEADCNDLIQYGVKLIDAGNNFCTKDKLRCGKWTREVLFDRMM